MENIKLDERLDRIERLLIGTKKRTLTFDEAADYTGITKSYLYKLTASAKIPHSKPNGKMIFFDRQELDNWLLANKIKTQSQIELEALSYTIKKKA